MTRVHRLDRYRFIDTSSLEEGDVDEDGDRMQPWPTPQVLTAALAPGWKEVEALLGVPASDLDLALSLVSADLLTSRGAGYFPPNQLRQPCRLLFDLALSRKAVDPEVFAMAIDTVVVGLGLSWVPEAAAVERAQERLEALLEEAGLTGGSDDAEDEDE